VKRVLPLVLLLAACASSKPVDMSEARRVVGTENDVRLDAEVFGDTLTRNTTIPVKYDVTNHRGQTILIADLIPTATYDAETQTVTIELGSEVPGEQFLPRLIAVKPGERRSFTGGAHVLIPPQPQGAPWMPRPRALRLKMNFLGGNATKAFEKLIDIPERAVHDPALATEIFPKWVEINESVITNSLPMRWGGAGQDEATPATPGRRRAGGT
jgi:hypothetical protein